ncbi:Uncharacterised protein [uncultured archaeon]|nr:Uncharacterised protein [uncultured archaeon]
MQLPRYHPIVPFVLFGGIVLLFTSLDFLVNSTLYHFGLVFDNAWFGPYSWIYLFMYQFAILLLWLPNRDMRFMIFGQAFFWSATQDLVYFMLWQGYMPAANQDWWWSNYRLVFGSWTTPLQITISTIGCTLAVTAILLMTVRGYRPPKCACG